MELHLSFGHISDYTDQKIVLFVLTNVHLIFSTQNHYF